MTVSVLVVDDSAFFRRRVTEILEANSDIKVIGTANNGEDAVVEAKRLRPDVITMDIEMPVLDGISAVRQIMATAPTQILMFSSLTHEGAQATLNALDAGAVDFLPKKFEDIARNRDDAVAVLQQRVLALGGTRTQPVLRTPAPAPRTSGLSSLASRLSRSSDASSRQEPSSTREQTPPPRREVRSETTTRRPSAPIDAGSLQTSSQYQLLAIGTSTGGPVALQQVLIKLPANFPYPIVMVQHMPAAFTNAFAERLNGLCQITVSEAADGDALKPGHAYLAPGGKQMLIEGRAGNGRIRIREDENARLTYRPSVDLTFASLAKSYQGKVLGVILTGMGADGREGCRMLKELGAKILAQDEATSVVYGMPQAVTQAGIAEKNIPLPDIAAAILREVGYRR
ncbi:MAG: chemotaxis response regulator protein-glutamate methylesterase [Idiomarina sp.]